MIALHNICDSPQHILLRPSVNALGGAFRFGGLPFRTPGFPNRVGVATDEARNLYQIGFILLLLL